MYHYLSLLFAYKGYMQCKLSFFKYFVAVKEIRDDIKKKTRIEIRSMLKELLQRTNQIINFSMKSTLRYVKF